MARDTRLVLAPVRLVLQLFPKAPRSSEGLFLGKAMGTVLGAPYGPKAGTCTVLKDSTAPGPRKSRGPVAKP